MNYKLILIFSFSLAFFLACETIKVDNNGVAQTQTTANSGNSTGVNKAPTANAGSDRTVKAGETITIIGSGTDSDGTIVDYEWYEDTQIISGNKTLIYVSTQEGNHTLKLNVFDDAGAGASDTMILTVLP